jgi:ADP-ribosyl-[dinitrogen reductase] hydrolase
MAIRTSLTHPLEIAAVAAPGAKGAIGITFCPGKKQSNALSGAWDRDLGLDLDAIKAWGASTLITLIEPQEIKALKVQGLGQEVIARGMDWLHWPITDVRVPDHRFEVAWERDGRHLIAAIRNGSRVLVHCKGGLGRAGTIAALMLVELGMDAGHAIRAVRAARPGAIETRAQEEFVAGRAWQTPQMPARSTSCRSRTSRNHPSRVPTGSG